MSNEAIYKVVSLLRISFENEDESVTLYSVTVNYLSIGTKDFAKFYEQEPMTERIGRSGGNPLVSLGFSANLA